MSSSSSTTSEAVVIGDHKRKHHRTIETDSDEHENADDLGEPVLSHAEKRRRKKEAKSAEKLKDGEIHPKKRRKLKDGTPKIVDPSAASTKQRQNSVWVGNLSYKTQHENLRDFFKWAGDITRINMPTKIRGGQAENRGCVCCCGEVLLLIVVF